MASLGLGCCLADDMGLGKTITLIAFHLHRQTDPATAGPTLVVCPASLLGNWEREIHRFAPGTPVRRYHGPDRTLPQRSQEGFVLTTYGTMRLDCRTLRAIAWGLAGGRRGADGQELALAAPRASCGASPRAAGSR